MRTVYIPNIVRRMEGGKLRPVFDFTPAASFGKLKEIIEEFDDLLFTDHTAAKVASTLADFKPGDYLLAVGDPTAIALCAGILFRKHECVNMLKWDRKSRKYIELELKL